MELYWNHAPKTCAQRACDVLLFSHFDTFCAFAVLVGMNFLELAKRSYYVRLPSDRTKIPVAWHKWLANGFEMFGGQHLVPPHSDQLCDPGHGMAPSQFIFVPDAVRVVIQLVLEEVVNRSMAQHLRMRFTQVASVIKPIGFQVFIYPVSILGLFEVCFLMIYDVSHCLSLSWTN